jgi:cytosine/adenosine deaminase-related metal-dependent hydrolase
LVTNATFLTTKAGETQPFVGYMLVDDSGKIAAIAAGAPPAEMSATQTLDATGKILVPGFISAHSHAPMHRPTAGKIIAFPEVGGLHHRYERRAA